MEDLSPVSHPRGIFPYEYSYSINENGTFIEIPRQSDQNYNNPSMNSYDGAVRLNQVPDEFIVVGNHIHDAVVTSLPARATHIDFWYRASEESVRELVHRVALQNLNAWRLYVEPVINSN